MELFHNSQEVSFPEGLDSWLVLLVLVYLEGFLDELGKQSVLEPLDQDPVDESEVGIVLDCMLVRVEI